MPRVGPPREVASWGNVARKIPAIEAKSEKSATAENPPLTLGDRIRAQRLELAALEQQQRAELTRAITTEFGDTVCAAQVWDHPELRRACLDADLDSSQAVGYWMRGAGFQRLYRDDVGIVWEVVGSENLQEDARIPGDDDV